MNGEISRETDKYEFLRGESSIGACTVYDGWPRRTDQTEMKATQIIVQVQQALQSEEFKLATSEEANDPCKLA